MRLLKLVTIPMCLGFICYASLNSSAEAVCNSVKFATCSKNAQDDFICKNRKKGYPCYDCFKATLAKCATDNGCTPPKSPSKEEAPS